MTINVDTGELRRQLILSAEELTPLPAAVTQLAMVLADAEATASDVGDVVRQDPVLTASLLREANSSWVAANEAIATVERAFILLGRARLLMLAVKDHVDEQLQPELPQYGLARGELWQHSVAASTAAGVIRDAATHDPGGAVITSALLHDLGKLVLCDYIDLSSYAGARLDSDLSAIERELVQIDHGELAGVITRAWGLPDIITDALIFHHDPEASSDPLAAHAVWLADVVAHQALQPHDENDGRLGGAASDQTDDSLDALGIDAALPTLVSRTQEFLLA